VALQAAFSGQGVNVSSTIGASSKPKVWPAPQKKETTMLTKFAAALLATSLIAGSAIAAQPLGNTGSTPAAQTQAPSAPAATMNKAGKTVKHTARHRSHVRKHVARGRNHVVHHARHAKPAKTHQAGVAAKRS
jgi:hypothetical protein